MFQENYDGGGKEIKDATGFCTRKKAIVFGLISPTFLPHIMNRTIPYRVPFQEKEGGVPVGLITLRLYRMKRKICIPLPEPVDIARLAGVREIRLPAGNEYWKMFDWETLIKATPLYKSSQPDIRIMSYNIHHGIS